MTVCTTIYRMTVCYMYVVFVRDLYCRIFTFYSLLQSLITVLQVLLPSYTLRQCRIIHIFATRLHNRCSIRQNLPDDIRIVFGRELCMNHGVGVMCSSKVCVCDGGGMFVCLRVCAGVCTCVMRLTLTVQCVP